MRFHFTCILHFKIHLLIHWWTLGYFLLLDIVNNAAINMGVQVCLWDLKWPYHMVILFYFTDSREREGKRERKRNIDVRETLIGCLPHMPQPRTKPQPKYVPWLGIERVTFLCMEQCSNQLSHTGQVVILFLIFWGTTILFFIVDMGSIFTFPSAMHRHSDFFLSFPIFIIFWIFL